MRTIRQTLTATLVLATSLFHGQRTSDAHGPTFCVDTNVHRKDGWRWACNEPKSAHVASVMHARPITRHRVARVPYRAGYRIWQALMLITWYGPTGAPMANGLYPSVGWAACGYDLPLGARVAVSGLGAYTCGDRMAYQPWQHIDLFNVPIAGAGYRLVTVYD